MRKFEPLKEIFTRTCCRDFDPNKKIDEDQINLILKAGQAAPSAKNRQPYFLIAIFNKDCRKEIFEAAQEGRRKQFGHLSPEDFESMESGNTGSNDKSIYEASAAILVLRNSNPSYSEAKDEKTGLEIKEEQGVANTAYSMLLQAEKLGINSGWICSPLYITSALKEILPRYGINWNDNWQPRLIIPLGYSISNLSKIDRTPLKDKTAFIR